MSEGVIAAIGMGGNLGDRLGYLASAVQHLADQPRIEQLRISHLYETEAVDCPEPFPFLNGAAVFRTTLPAPDLLQWLLQLELACGRERPYINAPRPLDLDLLIYGDLTVTSPELTVPHPRMHERLFVLAPLAELLAEWIHPLQERSILQLTAECRARSSADAVTEICHPGWPYELYR